MGHGFGRQKAVDLQSMAIGLGLGTVVGGLAFRLWDASSKSRVNLLSDVERPAGKEGEATREAPKMASGEVPDRLHDLLLQLGHGRRHVFQLENQVLAESYGRVAQLQARLKSAETSLTHSATTHCCNACATSSSETNVVPSCVEPCNSDEDLAGRIRQAVTTFLGSPGDATEAEDQESDGTDKAKYDGAHENASHWTACPVSVPFMLEEVHSQILQNRCSSLQRVQTQHDIAWDSSEDLLDAWTAIPDASDEVWNRRFASRARQIAIGKSRPEYQRYCDQVPVEERGPLHPQTPDSGVRCSKREFDRVLADWRRRLHEFDEAGSVFQLRLSDFMEA